MRIQQLTVVAFCQVVLASIVLYSTTTLASPLCVKPDESSAATKVEAPVKDAVAAKEQQPHKALAQVADVISENSAPSVEPTKEVVAKVVQQAAPVVVAASKVESVAAPPKAEQAAKDSPLPVVGRPLNDVVLTERSGSEKRKEEEAVAPINKETQLAGKSGEPAQPVKQVEAAQQQQYQQQEPSKVVFEQKSEPVVVVAGKQPVEAAVEPKQKQHLDKEPLAAKQETPVEQKKVAAAVAQQPLVVAGQVEPVVQQKSLAVAADQSIPYEPLKQLVVAVQQPVQPAALKAAPVQSVVVAADEPVMLKLLDAEELAIIQKKPIETPVAAAAAAAKVEVVAEKGSHVERPAQVAVAEQPQMAAGSFAAVKSSAPLAPKGGLGPLHMLATTLCSYQPDKPVADEHLNQLYARRATVRKALFDFMSLKFTNLEKLSSRLGYDLQVVPVKAVSNQSRASGDHWPPSHGWPVVGKCTAHDLKLMGEAAWCECEGNSCQQQQPQQQVAGVPLQKQTEQPQRAIFGRSIGPSVASLSPEQSSVISKILHVGDIKDAPIVESAFYNLNLTQQQLASLEAHATSTRECRRNALQYTKMLFNHLAEDQKVVSESWPKLHSLVSEDDCARKRLIDIVNALSSFRTDTTSIRRDNLEFAFAMDDLRVKVLESEVNVPLTFDKQFIEVEQFLQQSVRLMLSNIDPNRAKLTSARYRSLMFGPASDDQCLDLHQRLLANTYPTDCNPNQFGQLPDVLRMTATSLELWSIEKELSLHKTKIVDYPNSSVAGQPEVKVDVNECIANLISS